MVACDQGLPKVGLACGLGLATGAEGGGWDRDRQVHLYLHDTNKLANASTKQPPPHPLAKP